MGVMKPIAESVVALLAALVLAGTLAPLDQMLKALR